jgi:hypothetical protein
MPEYKNIGYGKTPFFLIVNKGKLKQVGKNGILVVEDIKTMNELFSFLDKMKKAAIK